MVKRLLRLSDGQIMFEEAYKTGKDLFDIQNVTVTGDREVKSYKVRQKLMTGAETLETNEWAGCYIPIVPVYGDVVNVEGVRYFPLADPRRETLR